VAPVDVVEADHDNELSAPDVNVTAGVVPEATAEPPLLAITDAAYTLEVDVLVSPVMAMVMVLDELTRAAVNE
jgi:hypothetical protein